MVAGEGNSAQARKAIEICKTERHRRSVSSQAIPYKDKNIEKIKNAYKILIMKDKKR